MLFTRAFDQLLNLINLLVFIRVISSWLPISPYSKAIQFLYMVTEPILAPIRKLLDQAFGGRRMMLDFSPIVALLVLEYVIRPIVLSLLRGM